jgi:hypothetical protein
MAVLTLVRGFTVLALAGTMSGQGPPSVRTLAAPTHVLPLPFTRVQGVRETRSGTAIVLDQGDRTVFPVDLADGRRAVVGRTGAGPGEYLLPARLFALPGDSTAVFDEALRRLLVLDPVGRPVAVRPVADPANLGLHAGAAARVFAIDAAGRLYGVAQPLAARGPGVSSVADSAAIERWLHGSTRRDTVGFVPVARPPGAAVVGGIVVWRPGAIHPFAPAHAVAIAPDGRVALVHPNPYRVEYIEPDARRRTGPMIAYEPIRVTEVHRREWLRSALEPMPGLRYARDGTRSVTVITPSRADLGELRWPRFLPPFHQQAVWFDRGGTLWIQRTTPPGQPPLFDRVGRDGRVLEQVRLPPRTRVVGFGDGTVYVVHERPDGLEFLQRHFLPARGTSREKGDLGR